MMAFPEWRLSLKLVDQPSLPKSVLQFPESEPGDVPPGGYRVATLKQLVSAQLPDAVPDPDLIDLVYCGRKLKDDLTLDAYGIKSGSTVHILKKSWPEPEPLPEPVDRAAAAREFRVLQAAIHTSTAYRDSVFKMLNNKESLDQIIVATPGLSSDPVALGILQDKDLFVQFTDPNMLDVLISAHPALVNAIILVLHSVTGSVPAPQSATSSRNLSSGSYGDMPGGFLFEGLSDDDDDFQSGGRGGPSTSVGGSAGMRPVTLGYSGALGPRPITQSELATALALASTPDSSAVTPTTSNQVQGPSSGVSPVPAGTPITNDLFNQALQQALQVSSMSSLQSQWQSQLQQLRDMGIRDEELILRALQATGGDIQAALELIFAGGAP
ncbi:ubiquitin-like protein 7a isoform X1 [Alosa alosa]|uniref:ubiquitin-like protein 7a isoform X1 n=1 Tax=Alosa sapidissima TaxID=34773 RepID=UPI001C082C02|nr:ubiquitin-like protein 7a isoform X1 [Alosa sapidissima]XP_041965906.1 ubiquitin-like protein 7a isoform X1 [Alosa sapidissima]XP_048112578.1 ubiquitin-like protein 7a isoform X1 [Alosa alosa]XP_048112579.1 ubiquitin-like protein 7a isoform X1 [Alosa alosa]